MYRALQLLLIAFLALLSSCPTIDDAVGMCIDETTYGLSPDSSLSPTLVIPIVVHTHINDMQDVPKADEYINELVHVTNMYLSDYDVEVRLDASVYGNFDADIVLNITKGRDDVVLLQENSIETWDDGRVHVYMVHSIYDELFDITYGGFYYHDGESCRGIIAIDESYGSLKILAHELGHMLGLSHVDDSTNMMFPAGLDDASGFYDDQGVKLYAGAAEYLCMCWQ